MKHTARRLTRSARDRVFGGVCGGLASYLDIDPVLVRVLYVGLTIISGGFFGIALYIIGWIIIPLGNGLETEPAARLSSGLSGRRMLGVLLIVVGTILVLASVMPFSWHFSNAQTVGPILLVIAGVVLIIWKRDSDANKDTYQSATTQAPVMTPESPAEENIPADEAEPASDTASRPNRMYRLENGRKIAGVCAGLGEYFDIDPTIIRLFWIMLALIGAVGVVLYLIMWIVMPLRIDPPPSFTGVNKS